MTMRRSRSKSILNDVKHKVCRKAKNSKAHLATDEDLSGLTNHEVCRMTLGACSRNELKERITYRKGEGSRICQYGQFESFDMTSLCTGEERLF